MADFDAVYMKTLGHEGGYVNDPADKGGETYKGISRRFHPGWLGWEIIDAKKNDPDFPKCLPKAKVLNDSFVFHFYREHFWNRSLGDEIPDQAVAEELFDTAVNAGMNTAVKFLQQALNALNRNQKLFPDLVEDGEMAEILGGIKGKFILSINDHSKMREVFKPFKIKTVTLHYTVAEKQQTVGKELLLSNF